MPNCCNLGGHNLELNNYYQNLSVEFFVFRKVKKRQKYQPTIYTNHLEGRPLKRGPALKQIGFRIKNDVY